MFGKKLTEKNNKNINAELVKLVLHGKLLNTSGKNGATGSFVINPEFENFDSRSLYANKDLDADDLLIEGNFN